MKSYHINLGISFEFFMKIIGTFKARSKEARVLWE